MRTLIFASLLALGLVGCSGSGGERVENTLRESIGTYTPTDIRMKVPEILTQRHNYEFERVYDSDEQFYYETRWKEEIAEDDEAALGAEMTRHRFIVEARPSSRSAESLVTYRVMVRGEREARMTGKGTWEPIPLTAMGRDELRRVVNDLKVRLETGIQRR